MFLAGSGMSVGRVPELVEGRWSNKWDWRGKPRKQILLKSRARGKQFSKPIASKNRRNRKRADEPTITKSYFHTGQKNFESQKKHSKITPGKIEAIGPNK